MIRLMAHDYMVILASTCLAEWFFSMLAQTDDVRCHQMDSDKFGSLQWLQSAYQDGQLEALNEAWMEIDLDFSLDTDNI